MRKPKKKRKLEQQGELKKMAEMMDKEVSITPKAERKRRRSVLRVHPTMVLPLDKDLTCSRCVTDPS